MCGGNILVGLCHRMLDMVASKVKKIVFSAAFFCKEELALERQRERERNRNRKKKCRDEGRRVICKIK